jgi:hypothetical protein
VSLCALQAGFTQNCMFEVVHYWQSSYLCRAATFACDCSAERCLLCKLLYIMLAQPCWHGNISICSLHIYDELPDHHYDLAPARRVCYVA